jgi:hypothetical protein
MTMLPLEEFHARQAAKPNALGQMYRRAQREWLTGVEVALARFPVKDLRLQFKTKSGGAKGEMLQIEGVNGLRLVIQINPDFHTAWVSGMVSAKTLHHKAKDVGGLDHYDFAKWLYDEISERLV